jgi:DNA-binding MarR family transcriptional regulator
MVSTNQTEAVPQALGRLRVALEDAYLRASRELGLTPQQAELLCAALSPAAVGDLATALRCDRSNVSRLVDRGSARGLLRRRGHEEDARITVVELTPAGESLARRFIAALEAQSSELRAGWSADRQRLTAELLNEIADALEAQRPAPGGHRRRQTSVPQLRHHPPGRKTTA